MKADQFKLSAGAILILQLEIGSLNFEALEVHGGASEEIVVATDVELIDLDSYLSVYLLLAQGRGQYLELIPLVDMELLIYWLHLRFIHGHILAGGCEA